MEAVPRLKARFPDSDATRAALAGALGDVDEAVRCEAISAVTDLALPGAGDLLAAALSDPEPDVRYFAAMGLQHLDDPRAPADPTSFAYGNR
ncbi:MAG TPA: HEAT repeat domain-containing protein [Candidatus Dormibacteraeota bacterium]|jgi:HEAT repeat protein|nr:HEAT repeat domain-containing protein [Candidatus Dormibacteraeota bacterium]